MLKENYGEFLDNDAELIIIPVSGDGNISEWLNKASQKWPDLIDNYHAAFKANRLKSGHILLTHTGILSGIQVMFAVTRSADFLNARPLTIRNLLSSIQSWCRANNIKTVAMTRLGHKEGLSWDHWIKAQYIRVLEYEMDCQYNVYLY